MRGGVRLSGLFQFHKGTIRTKAEAYHGEGSGDFNSIKVRLELVLRLLSILQKLYFNSIKVRLEHKLKDTVFDLSVFQFHKGTIRTFLKLLNML